ncbi:rRNA-processing protein las1 [Umbelopsis sp. WA50703]
MAALKPDGSAALTRSSMTEMQNMLAVYKDARKRQLKEMKTIKSIESRECTKAIKKILSTVSIDIIRDGLIPVLIDIGGIVPAGKKKRSNHPTFALSDDVIDLWAPLLRHLDMNYVNFAEEFVSALLSKLTVDEEPVMDKSLLGPFPGFFESIEDSEKNPAHASTSYMSTIVAWLKYIIESTAEELDSGANSVLQEVTLDDILEYCLKNPNLYTRHLLKIMTDVDVNLGEKIEPFMNYIDNMLSERKKKSSTVTELNEEQMEEDLNLLSTQIDVCKRKVSDV